MIFLDIQMPGISGLEIAKRLKDHGRNQNIVFVTGYDYLVFPALNCFPFYFLRKSKVHEEIYQIVNQFINQNEMSRKVFQYKVMGNIQQLLVDDIMYLSYWEHRIVVVCSDNEKIIFRGKIKDCEQQLSFEFFFRANSGTIVNLKYCEQFQDGIFRMKNQEKITVSREHRKKAKELFMKYWRSRL